ncbi:hypothetical protein [Agrococcus sp. Marseille-Q4369]|uniref:COG4315 family predicted lipoprotein n=1 Tax=Agrococcus sp. Marseille-Q4369 TaxID=2810513 RepID=UPI00201699A2|nr:hypothetical protein [Agrococcus sp. Marseille-Q4369]
MAVEPAAATTASTASTIDGRERFAGGDRDRHEHDATGELGTIVGVDGATQVTLNGWPLYDFAGDSAAGDVAGQGVNDVWWVLSPAGERMAE